MAIAHKETPLHKETPISLRFDSKLSTALELGATVAGVSKSELIRRLVTDGLRRMVSEEQVAERRRLTAAEMEANEKKIRENLPAWVG